MKWLPKSKWDTIGLRPTMNVAAYLVDDEHGKVIVLNDHAIGKFDGKVEVERGIVVHKRGECGEEVEKHYDSIARIFDKQATGRVVVKAEALRALIESLPEHGEVALELCEGNAPVEVSEREIMYDGEHVQSIHAFHFSNGLRVRAVTDNAEDAVVALFAAPTQAIHVEQVVSEEYIRNITEQRLLESNTENSEVAEMASEVEDAVAALEIPDDEDDEEELLDFNSDEEEDLGGASNDASTFLGGDEEEEDLDYVADLS